MTTVLQSKYNMGKFCREVGQANLRYNNVSESSMRDFCNNNKDWQKTRIQGATLWRVLQHLWRKHELETEDKKML